MITEIKNIDHMKLLAKWEVDKCLLQASGLSSQWVWHKFIRIQNEVSYVIGKNTPIKKKKKIPFEGFSIEHILIIF